jgi:DNA-directed RNA polymerase specialized sigma subunit
MVDRFERKRLTELLKSVPLLKIKLRRDKQDITDMQKEKFDESTFHTTREPEGPQIDDEIRHLQKVRNRERAALRTEKLLERLETAIQELGLIDSTGSTILERRYLKCQSFEKIAQELYCSKSSIEKKHRKALEGLLILVCGIDALIGQNDI